MGRRLKLGNLNVINDNMAYIIALLALKHVSTLVYKLHGEKITVLIVKRKVVNSIEYSLGILQAFQNFKLCANAFCARQELSFNSYARKYLNHIFQ